MLLIVLLKFLILFVAGEALDWTENHAKLYPEDFQLTVDSNEMTMKQIRNSGKIMRKTCQPKNNVEDEQIDPINDGVFLDDRDVKCYIACIMKMANTMKNGKFNHEAAIKQADLMLPDEIKEPAKEALTACKKVGDNHKDNCDASFYVTKCIYEHNPAIFYFP